MDLSRTLDTVDALVIVHPDFLRPDQKFMQDLAFATYYMESCHKPVISLPDESLIEQRYPESLWSIWQPLPEEEYLEPSMMVGTISRMIDKPAKKLVVGYAGIYYGLCVASYAYRTSIKYAGPDVPRNLESRQATVSAGKGIVIESLCLKDQ